MMKKFLQSTFIVALGLFMTGGLFGQNYVFFEDFENGLPADWTVYDVDMAPQNAGVGIDFSQGGVFGSAWTGPISFQDTDGTWMVSCSWIEPAGQVDDWLVTAPFEVAGAGYNLGWTGWATDQSYPDGYSVYIATENTVEAFLDTEPVFSIGSEVAPGMDRTFNLDAYEGQTVYAAFRNNSTDQFYLALTNIFVIAPPEGTDAVLNSVDLPIEFGSYNPSQAPAMNGFGGTVFNNSGVELTGAQLRATIFQVDSADVTITTEVWSETSAAAAAIPPVGSAVLSIDAEFLPLSEGLYILTYEVLSDLGSTDDDLANNFSSTYPFYVDPGVQSRSLPEIGLFEELAPYAPEDYYVGSLTMDAGAEGQQDPALTNEFGTTIQVVAGGSSLDSVLVLVNGDAGIEYTAKVYGFEEDGSISVEPLAESGTAVVPAEGENWGYNVFAGGVSLSEGFYIVTVVDPDNGDVAPIFTNYYEGGEGVAGSYFWQSDVESWIQGVGIVDDELGFVSAIPSIYSYMSGAATFVDFGVDLNSFTGEFAGFANGFVSEWNWDFGDGNTGTGQNVSHTFSGGGPFNVCVEGLLDDGTILGPACQEVAPACAVEVNVQATTSSLQASVSNATDPVTITWYLGQDTSGDPVGTGESLSDLESGIEYTVVVVDGTGCEDSEVVSTNACSFEVTEPTIVDDQISWQNSLVNGEPVYTFLWDESIGASTATSGLEDHPNGDWSITIIDGNGCEQTVEYTINFTGLTDIEGTLNATISPNPSQGLFQLDITFDRVGELQLAVYNLAGQMVKTIDAGKVNNFSQSLDLTNVDNGIYLLQVRFDDQVSMEKLVINK